MKNKTIFLFLPILIVIFPCFVLAMIVTEATYYSLNTNTTVYVTRPITLSTITTNLNEINFTNTWMDFYCYDSRGIEVYAPTLEYKNLTFLDGRTYFIVSYNTSNSPVSSLSLVLIVFAIIGILIYFSEKLKPKKEGIPFLKYMVWYLVGWVIILLLALSLNIAKIENYVEFYPLMLTLYSACTYIMIFITGLLLIGIIVFGSKWLIIWGKKLR